ncbi:MAG: hypothetical protein PHC64_00050 [Candidatus Gastranaerophilales bacterium]|nr:hypothetical protein [Candidatus Gastranaerophilales bacterium]
MNQFNLGDFINKFINYSVPGSKSGVSSAPNSNTTSGTQFKLTNEALNETLVKKTVEQQQTGVMTTFSPSMLAELKMNNLASLERSLYIKDLMKLPKEMEEVLVLLQNKAVLTEETAVLLSKSINLSVLAELIQKSGKEAMNKLVLVMANASKQGLTDVSQIKDAIKFINASVSVASKDNPNQILKSFMLLYLPWLPLQEGVDFELEIESSQGGEDDSEISITILISTRNYGNVRVTLILLKGNSMDIVINCCEEFPKDELLKRVKAEGKTHSIQSNVFFEQNMIKNNDNKSCQAKINMSNLMEVNPFLLLMANAIIRYTIELDNSAE